MVEVSQLSNFKLYYRTTAIKTAGYWLKKKTYMKTSGTESPDMNPRSYTHLIFDKGARNIR
jgi:hypothetical protein